MLAILRKEINSFFSSSIGYLVIAIFLILNGLFLWFFKSEFNIFNYGFADLTPFFTLAPWIFIFLIPAITMRSFSEEKRLGTLELLLTKPISGWHIVLGKYFGAFVLILIALIPTLLYVYTVWILGNPEGNLDVGSTLGSYFGLLFLIAAYTSIGVFTSTLSQNQIVAFIAAVFICFLLYFGFEGIANADVFGDFNNTIEKIGMKAHFDSIARGVIDTRDVIYFLSVTIFFLFLTVLQLKKR
ncbi:gliding motility-associated ABC transporter permease subunit GldF [Kordia sp. YSTF-M3]|uniref:Gliding motility-associated ABC transporter permease subunit GldF n=1 Tax=Kordia aestuariivivens TaxID=2759037 RepID=A0ABR7QCT7_9FLAO|nr:gliding motility-associated ABC transporter permease subunit GldF [Kordia aestuariivivens]MBC8756365.1 gliding motility-associated ABC transporter permease subunit GldF [Kordia aestuariivivens]